MRNKYIQMLFLVIYDAVVSVLSVLTSVYITHNTIDFGVFDINTFSLIAYPFAICFSFYISKVYNVIWRYARFSEMFRLLAAGVLATSLLYISQMAVFSQSFSLSTLLINLIVTMFFVIIQRFALQGIYSQFRFFSENKDKSNAALSGNTMVIGAGSAGLAFITEILNSSKYSACKIRCLIDDNENLKDKSMCGVHIIGGRDCIVEAVRNYNINTIVFAIPSATKSQKSDILEICQKTNCKLLTIPSLAALDDNPIGLPESIRRVEIEDLLGREPIQIKLDDANDYIHDKCVLVTGGGGSIGSELCRQISVRKPRRLIIFDIYENNAYDIQNELKKQYPELDLITLIGSVRDTKRLNYIFNTYRPEIVFHAAAHKHVPLMEDSPNEAIKNNVFGTLNTVKCADNYGVQRFILISTDKAVNPTNVMGATKRICEMIVQMYDRHSDTEFFTVRFGNVLGSNGSVIPLFKKQIEQGGPVTVTDPNIIRYFMTIPEAVSLVLKVSSSAVDGGIYVLNMGKPVKILTLAENLIRLSGFEPYTDIKIKFTGLRPGEKLYEELLMSEEGLKHTADNLIFEGSPINFDEDELRNTLSEISEIMYDENCDIRKYIKKIVPTFNYQETLPNKKLQTTVK